MKKPGKISLLGLILLLLLLGNNQVSHAHARLHCLHFLARVPQKATERHFTQAPISSSEYELGNHKVKVRFKGGECPFINTVYNFRQRPVIFIDLPQTFHFSSPTLSAYIFSSSLRGPPVTLSV